MLRLACIRGAGSSWCRPSRLVLPHTSALPLELAALIERLFARIKFQTETPGSALRSSQRADFEATRRKRKGPGCDDEIRKTHGAGCRGHLQVRRCSSGCRRRGARAAGALEWNSEPRIARVSIVGIARRSWCRGTDRPGCGLPRLGTEPKKRLVNTRRPAPPLLKWLASNRLSRLDPGLRPAPNVDRLRPRPCAIFAGAPAPGMSETGSSGRARSPLGWFSQSCVAAVLRRPTRSSSCTEVMAAISSDWCRKSGKPRHLGWRGIESWASPRVESSTS